MIKKENLKISKNIYLTGIIKDFPRLERIPYSRYKRALKNKSMHAYGYYVNNKRYGYIVTLEEDNVVFISYLAVNKNFRDKGFGSTMLKEFIEFCEKKKFIIIEVDSSAGIIDEKEINIIKKRNNFYYKNGFEEIKNTNYSIYGVKYDLLVYKINSKEITNKDAIEITKKCYEKIARNMKYFILEAL